MTARRRRNRAEEELPPDEPVIDPEELELETFLDSIGAEGSVLVKLYRIEQSGKRRFVQEGPPAMFSESQVQAEHGGGDYIIRSLIGGRWARSKSFSIAPLPGATLAVAGSSDKNLTSDVDRLKIELETQRLRLEQAQLALESERKEREQRNHEILMKILERGSGSNGGNGFSDMIEAVVKLQSLAGTKSLTDQVRELKAVHDLFGDRDEKEPSIMGVIKELAPQLFPMIPAMLQGAAQRGGNGAMPPALLPVQKAAVAPESANDTAAAVSELSNARKQVAGYLVNMARLGRPPALYAEMAIEQAQVSNDPIVSALIQELRDAPKFETWFADLEKLDSTLVVHRPWFEEFFRVMREILMESETAETTTGRTALNDSDKHQ